MDRMRRLSKSMKDLGKIQTLKGTGKVPFPTDSDATASAAAADKPKKGRGKLPFPKSSKKSPAESDAAKDGSPEVECPAVGAGEGAPATREPCRGGPLVRRGLARWQRIRWRAAGQTHSVIMGRWLHLLVHRRPLRGMGLRPRHGARDRGGEAAAREEGLHWRPFRHHLRSSSSGGCARSDAAAMMMS